MKPRFGLPRLPSLASLASLIGVAGLASSGCGLALAQTAKTEPPGHVHLTAGVVRVTNKNDAERHGPNISNYAPELSVRVGLAEHFDLGVSTWTGPGLRSDLKWSPLDRKRPFAIAARLGGGASEKTKMAMGGLIASYDLADWFTPYGGVTFGNYWFYGREPSEPPPVGTRYADRKGYGDGLVQLAVGLQIKTAPGGTMHLEYQRWIPAQNDPGDFFKFVANDVVFVGLSFCLNGPCNWL